MGGTLLAAQALLVSVATAAAAKTRLSQSEVGVVIEAAARKRASPAGVITLGLAPMVVVALEAPNCPKRALVLCIDVA